MPIRRLGALEDLIGQINDLAESLEDQISQANDEISSGVDSVNEILETIDSLNERISSLSNSGQSTADLEDELNSALVDLSEYMEITTFKNSDGSTKVYSASGQVLVDSEAHLLSTETAADGTVSIIVNGSDITNKLHDGDTRSAG
ncbi:hypothetical protein [uncultured Cohaesibacter sp.]|uniref:FlgK family flagellar hook-associated protein n=1 Tax=uncultured Cohaesibacter sp. TaxID=1002546 RepID=UPI0029C7112F|nr:hypothetical protein [uncultured Cohaesibacter sp.]